MHIRAAGKHAEKKKKKKEEEEEEEKKKKLMRRDARLGYCTAQSNSERKKRR